MRASVSEACSGLVPRRLQARASLGEDSRKVRAGSPETSTTTEGEYPKRCSVADSIGRRSSLASSSSSEDLLGEETPGGRMKVTQTDGKGRLFQFTDLDEKELLMSRRRFARFSDASVFFRQAIMASGMEAEQLVQVAPHRRRASENLGQRGSENLVQRGSQSQPVDSFARRSVQTNPSPGQDDRPASATRGAAAAVARESQQEERAFRLASDSDSDSAPDAAPPARPPPEAAQELRRSSLRKRVSISDGVRKEPDGARNSPGPLTRQHLKISPRASREPLLKDSDSSGDEALKALTGPFKAAVAAPPAGPRPSQDGAARRSKTRCSTAPAKSGDLRSLLNDAFATCFLEQARKRFQGKLEIGTLDMHQVDEGGGNGGCLQARTRTMRAYVATRLEQEAMPRTATSDRGSQLRAAYRCMATCGDLPSCETRLRSKPQPECRDEDVELDRRSTASSRSLLSVPSMVQ